MADFELKSSQFRAEREDGWRDLERLVAIVEAEGLKRLDADQLHRLPTLYRSAVSSLSVARAISLDRNLLEYLENLVGRAYIAVYSTKRPALEAIARFLVHGFPAAVRRHRVYLAASTALLLLGVLCGFLLTLADSERYYGLVAPEYAQGRNPGASTEALRAVLYGGTAEPDGDGEDKRSTELSELQHFATFLFTHNAKIGILCFALGFVAGAPTAILLFQNGLLLGAMGALYHSRGLGGEFWAWVLPHGITELGAVCLCGMAGLALGAAIVFPGEHSRLANLALRGREVAMAVIGAILLFFVAALIEGFFRQLVFDTSLRWAMAAATLLLWSGYFVLSGRRHETAAGG